MEERHLHYHAVIDALKQKECPICFLITKSIDSYFKTLLYENINDLGFKRKYREQQGFCNRHTYQFLKYNDRLAVLLTHKDLLMQKTIGYKKNSKIQFDKKNECMICDLEKETEKRYISVIIKYLNDEELKNTFIKSDGLCITHFEKITKRIKSKSKWFLDFHKSKYEMMLKQTIKCLEASNLSLGDKRPTLLPEDINICEKLVKTIYGYEGMQ